MPGLLSNYFPESKFHVYVANPTMLFVTVGSQAKLLMQGLD